MREEGVQLIPTWPPLELFGDLGEYYHWPMCDERFAMVDTLRLLWDLLLATNVRPQLMPVPPVPSDF